MARWLCLFLMVGVPVGLGLWPWRQVLEENPAVVYFVLGMIALVFLMVASLLAGTWGDRLLCFLWMSLFALLGWSLFDSVYWNLDPATAKSEWHYEMAQELIRVAILLGGVVLLIFLVWVVSLAVEGWRFRRACKRQEALRFLWEVVQGQGKK